MTRIVLLSVQGIVAPVTVTETEPPVVQAKTPPAEAEPLLRTPAAPSALEVRCDRCLGPIQNAPPASWDGRTGSYWCARCGPITRTRTVRVHYPGGA